MASSARTTFIPFGVHYIREIGSDQISAVQRWIEHHDIGIETVSIPLDNF